MNIILSKTAQKALSAVPQKQHDRIIAAIQGLLSVPPKGDIKKMQGKSDEYRLRVGNYRVIYSCESNDIDILDIGIRGDVYK